MNLQLVATPTGLAANHQPICRYLPTSRSFPGQLHSARPSTISMINCHNRIRGEVVDQTREKARGHELGHLRLDRYTAAYDWAVQCIDTGHYLEAIAVLDSLLGDRLASRYSYVRRTEPSVRPAVGQLCKVLLHGPPKVVNPPIEVDPQFRAVIGEIQGWAKTRNSAMHQTAKILRNGAARVGFKDILDEHRQTALDGIALLRQFDELDTLDRQRAGKRPGTWPNAFFPEKRPLRPRRDDLT